MFILPCYQVLLSFLFFMHLLFLPQIMGHGPWAPSLDLPLFLYIGRCRENSFDNLNIIT